VLTKTVAGGFSLAVALLLALPGGVAAQPVEAETRPLWEVGVMAGGVSMPAYPGAANHTSRALVLPFLIYRGEVLRSEQGTFGARLVHGDQYEVDVGFAGSLPASSKDTPARAGMPNLGTLAEFGPRLKVKLFDDGPEHQLRLDIPVRAVLELRSGVRQQGVAFEPELRWNQRLSGGWSVDTSAGLVWGDRSLNQYFYGVDAAYITPTRPAYTADAGLIATRLGMTVYKKLTPDVRLLGFARLDDYSSNANRSSPLFQKNSGTSVGVVLAWTLGRSAQTGHD